MKCDKGLFTHTHTHKQECFCGWGCHGCWHAVRSLQWGTRHNWSRYRWKQRAGGFICWAWIRGKKCRDENESMSGIREEEEKKILNPNEEERSKAALFACVHVRVFVCVLWQNENRDKCRSNKPPVPQRLRVTEESVHACERVCVLGMYYTRMLCACIMSNNHPYIRRYLYLQRKLRINHTDTHLNTTIVWGDEWENVQTRW